MQKANLKKKKATSFCLVNGLLFRINRTKEKRFHMTDVCLNMRFRHMKGCSPPAHTLDFWKVKAVIMVCGGDVSCEQFVSHGRLLLMELCLGVWQSSVCIREDLNFFFFFLY